MIREKNSEKNSDGNVEKRREDIEDQQMLLIAYIGTKCKRKTNITTTMKDCNYY